MAGGGVGKPRPTFPSASGDLMWHVLQQRVQHEQQQPEPNTNAIDIPQNAIGVLRASPRRNKDQHAFVTSVTLPTMATFDLHPLSRFATGQTSIKRPTEFTCFSYDSQKQLHPGSLASLRYYYPPFIQSPGTSALGISLSNGFQDWIKVDQSVDGHLDALLETIQAHEESLMAEGKDGVRVKADVVTWRGMMTKVPLAFPAKATGCNR